MTVSGSVSRRYGSADPAPTKTLRIRNSVCFIIDKVSGLMVGGGEGGGDRRVVRRGVAAQRVVMPRPVLYAHVPANSSR